MGVPLVGTLDLPRDPEAVAKAVLAGQVRRFDLLRNDGGSVTLDGAVVGGDEPFAARVEVDDAVLADGSEPLLTAVVANASRSASLTPRADPADGVLDVAVALEAPVRGRWGRRRPGIEVRRARGRAVAVVPRDEVPLVDDGAAGTLTHKRTWWMERAAWAVYT